MKYCYSLDNIFLNVVVYDLSQTAGAAAELMALQGSVLPDRRVSAVAESPRAGGSRRPFLQASQVAVRTRRVKHDISATTCVCAYERVVNKV